MEYIYKKLYKIMSVMSKWLSVDILCVLFVNVCRPVSNSVQSVILLTQYFVLKNGMNGLWTMLCNIDSVSACRPLKTSRTQLYQWTEMYHSRTSCVQKHYSCSNSVI